mgnify:CR=1 FL=1
MREHVAECLKGRSALVALSGGVDSVVLLHLLLALRAQVVAAHGAVCGLAGAAAEAAEAAENALENIVEAARTAGIGGVAAVVSARRGRVLVAKLVVSRSALVIGKHLVCFVDLLKRSLRLLIARV